jgi:hypothetical protein
VANALVALGVVLFPTMLAMTIIAAVCVGRRVSARARGPMPVGPPIERIAADLRRLHLQRRMFQAGPPNPGGGLSTRALTAAYVEVLTTACRVLEVDPPVVTAAGHASDQEIERVEHDLRDRGLDVANRGPG